MTPRSLSRRYPRYAGRDAGRGRIVRFDRSERAAHWLTALVVLTLLATGAVLYIPSLSVAVGRRLLVEDTHVDVGLAMFVPLLLASFGRRGAGLRNDLHAMSGLSRNELSWLRTFGGRGRSAIGKFNPGQKLNTYTIGGLLVVLFLTGLVMRWGSFLPISLRTGATFIHDVFAVALALLVAGHIAFALTHPQALRSMVTGWVPAAWAARHAPRWRPASAQPPVESAPQRAPVRRAL